jgi:hypothetical protein
MRKFFFIPLLLTIGLSMNAQYTGYSPVADPAKFKTDFSAANTKDLIHQK